jgi:hypothetical protein
MRAADLRAADLRVAGLRPRVARGVARRFTDGLRARRLAAAATRRRGLRAERRTFVRRTVFVDFGRGRRFLAIVFSS